MIPFQERYRPEAVLLALGCFASLVILFSVMMTSFSPYYSSTSLQAGDTVLIERGQEMSLQSDIPGSLVIRECQDIQTCEAVGVAIENESWQAGEPLRPEHNQIWEFTPMSTVLVNLKQDLPWDMTLLRIAWVFQWVIVSMFAGIILIKEFSLGIYRFILRGFRSILNLA